MKKAKNKPFLSSYALALLSSVLMFVGFAGIDLWPFALVAFVPLLFAFEHEAPKGHLAIIKIGLVNGFVAIFGGYYWLIHVLQRFSGFPLPLCVLLASILVVQMAGLFVLLAWLYARLVQRGLSATAALLISGISAEFIYPLLFPYYYSASFHSVPLLMQSADIGGPLLVSGLCFLINGTLYETLKRLKNKDASAWQRLALQGGLVALFLVYGAVRIQQNDALVAKAPKINVGMVQGNMGLLSKRNDPFEGLRRHHRLSEKLEEQSKLDLLVWPESAYAFSIPENMHNVKRAVMGSIDTPMLFGAVSRRSSADEQQVFNTAFITNQEGDILGSYDKTYLLAFGEYLPFGDTFPILYKWSPNSGHFTKGSSLHSLPFGKWRIGTLICYEDILPSFVRKLVNADNPHLLVNISNDAWFGKTTEPWEHLALAKFRAIEHRRFLVRSTNSGISAFVDPVGRLIKHTELFKEQAIQNQVAMLQGRSLYSYAGEWPGWLSLLLAAFFLRPRSKR
ncbi:MAG: apolipoprotein N-acyltransferase [Myxococcales bacterium]|nr:MAG: apolipoprotein N-acyltransferase [Myxococcales bacterium]